MKTDASVRNICIAAIKRSTIRPIDFPLTKIFDTESIGVVSYLLPSVAEDELPISQTFIDQNNWTIITTRQITTCKDGAMKSMPTAKVKNWDYNLLMIKEQRNAFVLGQLHGEGGAVLEIFIETGPASMITIRGVGTLLTLLA